jgi:hypothetical protein
VQSGGSDLLWPQRSHQTLGQDIMYQRSVSISRRALVGTTLSTGLAFSTPRLLGLLVGVLSDFLAQEKSKNTVHE